MTRHPTLKRTPLPGYLVDVADVRSHFPSLDRTHNPTLEGIKAGKTLKEIRESWQGGLEEFKKRRQKYLIY